MKSLRHERSIKNPEKITSPSYLPTPLPRRLHRPLPDDGVPGERPDRGRGERLFPRQPADCAQHDAGGKSVGAAAAAGGADAAALTAAREVLLRLALPARDDPRSGDQADQESCCTADLQPECQILAAAAAAHCQPL